MARFCNINYNQFINNVGYLKTKSFFPIKFEVCTLLFNIKHLDILKRYQFDVWFYICHKHVKIGGWVSIETCSILLETELNFIYNTTIAIKFYNLYYFLLLAWMKRNGATDVEETGDNSWVFTADGFYGFCLFENS